MSKLMQTDGEFDNGLNFDQFFTIDMSYDIIDHNCTKNEPISWICKK